MKKKTKAPLMSIIAAVCALAVCGATSAFTKNTVSAAVGATTEIKPYIEYTFDDADNFLKNTGTSASDVTKDYTLKINGNAPASDLSSEGKANFGENSSLYIPYKNNPFANDLTDFTITADLNLGKPNGWHGSVFSWDSFSSYNNRQSNSEKELLNIEGYNRIVTPTNLNGYTSGLWMRLSERTRSAKNNTNKNANPLKQTDSWFGADNLLSGADQSKTDETTGLITLVYSYKAGGLVSVSVYKDGKAVGTPVKIDGLPLYNADSTYKTFTISGCMDTRFITNLDEGNFITAQKETGTMDNIRIYDFAMTTEQMAEYAANKKISVAGVNVEETENGSVKVSNTTPKTGETVTITPVPDDGYEIDKVYVNDVELLPENGVYTTTMTENGLLVRATFKETAIQKLKAVSMSYGGSIRCGGSAENSGLRFRIEAAGSDYKAAQASLKEGATAEYGLLIIPEDYQSKYGEFTAENLFGATAKYHLAEKNEDGSLKDYDGSLPQVINFVTEKLYLNEKTGNYEYYGSITGVAAENLTRKFVGVGFVKYTDGDETQYAVLDYAGGDIINNTRSIYQVAKLAMLDEKLAEGAKAWIKENYIDVVETAVVKQKINGKKLSILGDSISTYQGVSNNTETNSTIGDNAVFYGNDNKTVKQADTWWQQAADETGMSVLVNNSWAGANVATNYGNGTKGGCTARAENLHDNNDTSPDIIAVYMGINDNGCLTALGDFNDVSDIWNGEKYIGDTEKFATAYAIMVHKIVTKYNAADVFLFTLPRNGYLWQVTKEQYNALQDEYNKMIYKIAEVFGCKVVDLATAVGENYSDYLLDDNIHPNAKGMDLITATFETALYSYYAEN